MDREQIRAQLIEILTTGDFQSLRVDPSTLTDETSLVNDVILDSLQLLDFVLAIEHAFGFRATTARLNIDIFDRFGGVIDFVQSSLAGGARAEQIA